MFKTILPGLLFLSMLQLHAALHIEPRQIIPFNAGWKFSLAEKVSDTISVYRPDYDDSRWTDVVLPHTAYTEPLVIVTPQQGVCYYRKSFTSDHSWEGKKVFLRFEGAMQVADVWLNGKHLLRHTGGYLPFVVDLSDDLIPGSRNVIAVKLDNRDNPQIPPGKSTATLDFCYYSGIYRNAELVVTNKLYIPDAVFADEISGGGNFITFPLVSRDISLIEVKTSVRNENSFPVNCQVIYGIIDGDGNKILESATNTVTINAFSAHAFTRKMKLPAPNLWSPVNPYLYTLETTVLRDDAIVDRITEKTGIREFRITGDKFFVNGEPLYLYGTNRHQEYPYIGNALPDNAQHRDVVKIKEAGFNIVRLSHYPQSEAFMRACDELGLLVINCIAGWQFFGDSIFVQHCYRDARELIRRDRNHACVAMWELSLNETEMSDAFMQQMNAIAREESPSQPLITCGWINKYYDVFMPARQHGQAPDYWKKHHDERPFFTAEYGDWEYYAQNAGFNQTEFADLKEEERTSRQLRGYGEKRLLQQALNFQEAHNDNLKSLNIGDANWLMFDYNRGYAPDIESSGIMDLFRIPKFAYWFYQSQRDPGFRTPLYDSGPMVKIAGLNTSHSDHMLKIYSNCEEVALYLDNTLVSRQKPSVDKYSDCLPHPPFIFDLSGRRQGTLTAKGYIGDREVAKDKVQSALYPSSLRLGYDRSGKDLSVNDAVFVYAQISDDNGNLCPEADTPVTFSVIGDGVLIGENPVKAEAGIASILLRTGTKGGKIVITAVSGQLNKSSMTLEAR